MSLKNFNPTEFIYTYRSGPVTGKSGRQYTYDPDPAAGTNWRKWWDGGDPRIEKEYASAMWPWLTDAGNCFISPDASWNPPTEYVYSDDPNSRALVIQRISSDLGHYFDAIKEVLAEEGSVILAPFIFEQAMISNSLLRENYVRAMAAYSVYCQDIAISGLLSGAPILSASGAGYAILVLDLAHRDQKLINPAGTPALAVNLAVSQERSRLARLAAEEKWRNSKEAEVKAQILGCLLKYGDQYKNKATFIRDMLDKYGDVVKTEKTIAKYVDESGHEVGHWKKRRKDTQK